MESEYTRSVLEQFKLDFQSLWIEDLNWSSSATKAFGFGMSKISVFRQYLVIQYSKLVLSGDHLINETEDLSMLQTIINGYVEDITPKKTLKVKLYLEFQSMLKDIIDIIRLVKNHIAQTEKKFQPNNMVISANFIPLNKSKHELVAVMDLVCDSCEAEYNFSYNDDYIRKLLFLRQYLCDVKSKYGGELDIVLNAVFSKIELLLGKLSAFSVNKKISFYRDLKLETIELEKSDNYPEEDFRNLFQKYLEPSKLDGNVILKWQKDSLKQSIAMWQLAFLMRYYTKHTKSIVQIDNLIELAEFHYDDYLSCGNHNVVNDCAGRSFLNYMYNSRFSFLCQCESDYTYEKMKNDLSKIKAVQSQTFINNYHPYQTAVNYTIKVIETKLSNHDTFEDVRSLVIDLKEYFQKYKDCVAWCKKFQPYLVQLRYNFSSITMDGCDFKTFCPSSFCRPLRFKELDEKVFEYASKIANLEYEAKNQENRKMLIDAKSKIDNMERKNMEQMGLFITLTTFLVGLLSVFIGNNGSVSIFEKMRYVIALGLILIVFICLGYFVVREQYSKMKTFLFIFLLIISALSLMGICCSSDGDSMDREQDEVVVKQ